MTRSANTFAEHAAEVAIRSKLDPGVTYYVLTLRDGGVETFESCEGGDDHAYPEPTVRFHGGQGAGWHALAVAQAHGLPVDALQRVWPINNGEPTGPYWQLTFRHPWVWECDHDPQELLTSEGQHRWERCMCGRVDRPVEAG